MKKLWLISFGAWAVAVGCIHGTAIALTYTYSASFDASAIGLGPSTDAHAEFIMDYDQYYTHCIPNGQTHASTAYDSLSWIGLAGTVTLTGVHDQLLGTHTIWGTQYMVIDNYLDPGIPDIIHFRSEPIIGLPEYLLEFSASIILTPNFYGSEEVCPVPQRMFDQSDIVDIVDPRLAAWDYDSIPSLFLGETYFGSGATAAAVPEPATSLLLGAGLIALNGLRKKLFKR